MKKLILNIALLIGISSTAIAQNEIDALRYSQSYTFGTARSSAMGGAFGTLGADMSELSINPAGIALYKGGDISFSPAFFYQQTKSSYNNNIVSDAKYAMNFNSAGVVLASKKEGGLFHSMAFGVAYNRTNNFTNAVRIESKNNNSSILDVYVAEANGTNASEIVGLYPFSSGLAFDIYLLDTIPGDTSNYFSVVPNGGTTQRKYIETIGGAGEFDMSFGLMVGDHLYLGATLAFPTVKYQENSTYEEIDEQDTISTIKHFEVYEHLTTTGNGFNAKFGAIFRIADLRVGAAIHSPSVLQMTDTYYTDMSATFDNDVTLSESTLDIHPYEEGGLYNYTITTPMKFTAGIAFIIAKMGAISADYELVDYSSARLHAPDYSFAEENNAITNNYKPTSNLRVGTEWKINPISLRAGYAYYGSPYTSSVDNDGSRSVYSAGIGFREKQFSLDFTYVFSQRLDKYYMYDPAFADAAATTLATSHNFIMSLGFRF